MDRFLERIAAQRQEEIMARPGHLIREGGPVVRPRESDLDRLLERHGLTRRELAELFDVPVEAVGRWARAEIRTPPEVLALLEGG